MNWYIGQEIVAIQSHQQGVFKRGQSFKIIGLMKCACKCNVVWINIGLSLPNDGWRCGKCGVEGYYRSLHAWPSENFFAPLDQDISELTEILEQPTKQVQEL